MTHAHLDLTPYLNAVCASPADDPAAGIVNAWGNSYPREEMVFGNSIVIDGAPFLLPPKCGDAPDHIECLGQWITDPAAMAAGAFPVIRVLGFGELGMQTLELIAEDHSGERRTTYVQLENWLRPSDAPVDPQIWRASKTRYAAGYDLDCLQPILCSTSARLQRPMQFARLQLGANPLAHVIAITLSER